MVIRVGDEAIIPPRPRRDQEEAKPKRVYIKKEDVVEHGATAGCPGCRAARLGQTAQGHTEECRRRITEEMAKTDQGKRRLEQAEERAGEEGELEEGDKTRYRAIAARCNYMAIDRPDLQYAAKEACRTMSCPKKGDMAKLKRIGRYLIGRMRVVYTFEWQEAPSGLTCYTDANWAGCTTTRKSTVAGTFS